MTIKELLIKENFDDRKHNICLIPIYKGKYGIPFTFEHKYNENCEVVKYKWNKSVSMQFDINLKYKGKDTRPTLNIYWLVK